MAFPVEGWRTSAAVVVRQSDTTVVAYVLGGEKMEQPLRGVGAFIARAFLIRGASVTLHMWLRREGPKFKRPGRR
jgi:hypothetical protein